MSDTWRWNLRRINGSVTVKSEGFDFSYLGGARSRSSENSVGAKHRQNGIQLVTSCQSQHQLEQELKRSDASQIWCSRHGGKR